VSIIVVGLNHETAPVEVREKVSFPVRSLPEILPQLVKSCPVQEGLIISTCNRTEIYGSSSGNEDYAKQMVSFMAEAAKLDERLLWPYIYTHIDEKAVRHIFRVASGLDSMIVGEAQILGQTREAFKAALDAGTAPSVLNALFRWALSAGKRARTETEIDRNAISISSAAVELSKKIFGELKGRTILILGAGKMSELTAKSLVRAGVSSIIVSNRTFERAQEIAEEFDGEAVPFDEIASWLKKADIILSSTASPHFIIKPPEVAEAMKFRRHHPLFIIDIAVPRDVDPAVGKIDGVYLYNIDDLELVIRANIKEREKEIKKVEVIVEEEVKRFKGWYQTLVVVPTIASLREKAEEIRQRELAKALSMLPTLSEKDRGTLDSLTQAIINKMLHAPVSRLKQLASGRNGYIYVQAANQLFDLQAQLPKMSLEEMEMEIEEEGNE